jgi:hypothetical protein
MMSSPPRRLVQQQQNPFHPPRSSGGGSSAIVVTPQGQQHDYHHGQEERSFAATTRRQVPHHVTPDHDNASGFSMDIFQNPDYGEARYLVEKTTINGSRERPGRSPGGKLSPTREQLPKRQRTLEKNAMSNTSTDSFTELLNTSGESNGTSSSSNTASAGLMEAIATQLTLEDRVIRSPTELMQSFAGGRRRSQQHPLPRPSKASSALDISADSMDGLAALSTAAFLRLDESY